MALIKMCYTMGHSHRFFCLCTDVKELYWDVYRLTCFRRTVESLSWKGQLKVIQPNSSAMNSETYSSVRMFRAWLPWHLCLQGWDIHHHICAHGSNFTHICVSYVRGNEKPMKKMKKILYPKNASDNLGRGPGSADHGQNKGFSASLEK